MGTDINEETFNKEWDYPLMIGMMMYTYRNAYPEILEDHNECITEVNVPKMMSRSRDITLQYHLYKGHIGQGFEKLTSTYANGNPSKKEV